MDTLDNIEEKNSISPAARADILSLGKWMRFTAIVFLVFSILSIFNSLFSLAATDELALMFEMMGMPSSAATIMIIVGLIFTIIQIYMFVLLMQAGNGFIGYGEHNNVSMLEAGFVKNQQAWLIYGVFAIIGIIVMIIVGSYAVRMMSMLM